MKEKDAKQQLIEAVDLIARLVQISISPASRNAAGISTRITPIREKRKKLKLKFQSAQKKFDRWGWLPFVGAQITQELEHAKKNYKEADAEWINFRTYVQNTKDILEAGAGAQAITKAIREMQKDFYISSATKAPLDALLLRAQFLIDSNLTDDQNVHRLAPKVFSLAKEAWRLSYILSQKPDHKSEKANHAALQQVEVPRITRAVKGGQLALDFDGEGQIEEGPRIWLPVSTSRTKEMLLKGARLDRDAPRRGSQLWIPVSERAKLEHLLPLAFRSEGTAFSFPPIRHNAVKQNLHSIFDRESWNHIRTTAYDRAGHRCQLCGKQGGTMWNKIATAEERKRGGVVDCHEVWEWEASEEFPDKGIQRLKRLLVLCKDCHACFHESFAMWRGEQAGISRDKVADYIRSLRMLINRCDAETLDRQIEKDSQEWTDNLEVKSWVIDLEHLANQDFMIDVTMKLREGNEANVGAEQIGGIRFSTEDGAVWEARAASTLIAPNQPTFTEQTKFKF